jgi:putative ABC transport system permease protein
MNGFLQDIHYALRQLRKNPGFTAVAVITLALGIGANTAIFGLVDSAFLRALPFREPGRLVHIWTIESNEELHTPTPEQYRAVLENSHSFQQVAAAGWADYFFDTKGSFSADLPGFLVTANWLPTLGIQPLLGRNFREQEQTAGQDGIVMLSYNCWHERFHADPHILGRQIVLNRSPVTVVGVLPQSLGRYYEDVEVFAPLVLDTYSTQGHIRAGKARLQIVGRLRSEVTIGQARAEAEVLSARLHNPGNLAGHSDHLVVEDFGEMFRHPGPTRLNAQRGLWLTAAAAGVVLLIACANVASLLMARGVKRQREVAVRTALGSSRARVIRQFLTEAALLFSCGGVFAAILTRCIQEIVTKLASGLLPGVYLHVDMRVVAAALGASLLCAFAFGVLPALQATHVNLNESLKDGTPNATSGFRSRRSRSALVGCQVAMGMTLLVGFGLLMRSFWNVQSSRLGYAPQNVLTATIRLPRERYIIPSEKARLMQAAVERMRSMPSVESVGITDSLPMQGAESAGVRIESPTPNAPPFEHDIYFVSVSPQYFSTLNTPMLSGRAFRETDTATSNLVAVVNQTFAKQFFLDKNPLGYHLAFSDSPTVWREIVGVVSDFRQRNPEEDLRPLAYFPVAQTLPSQWSMAIRLRAASDIGAVAAQVDSWLRPVDPQLFWELGSMQVQIHDSESLTLRRPVIALLASFGTLALALVIVGIFGVTSYSVAERTREVGIRVALGATRGQIAALVIREELATALLGLGVGILGAVALTRFFPTQGIGWSGSGIFLYGISRIDGLTYSLTGVLLIGVVLAACWLPARRASKVDPIVALRYE